MVENIAIVEVEIFHWVCLTVRFENLGCCFDSIDWIDSISFEYLLKPKLLLHQQGVAFI